MYLTHLVCSACSREHPASVLQNLCRSCNKPLLAQYDLKAAARTFTRQAFGGRLNSMWRYRELLPVKREEDIVTLGEGMTPLLRAPRAAARRGLQSLLIKDESVNPTQSFKARGMSAAVSMAKQLGAKKLAVPTAGNAGSALAAYAARAGLEAYVFIPKGSSQINILEGRQHNAQVTLIDGFITDCAAEVGRRKEAEGWFELSTLKEPYRIEGKKTMGFELAEQLDWSLPDAIIYPTGGGSGLIGMWKAFGELQALGLIGPKRPKMFSVQMKGCAPIVQAWNSGACAAGTETGHGCRPSGLRVPAPLGASLILEILKQSGGGAVAVAEEDAISAAADLGSAEGIFPAPEGAAGYAALAHLLKSGVIAPEEKIVLFNTGAGIKYLEWYNGEPWPPVAKTVPNGRTP